MDKTITEIAANINRIDYGQNNRHRILELSTSDENQIIDEIISEKKIKKTKRFSKTEIEILNLRKKALALRVLLKISDTNTLVKISNLLNHLIAKSIKLEQYDLVIELLGQKKYFVGTKLGTSGFNKISEEIIHYSKHLDGCRYANDLYYKVIMNQDFLKTINNSEIENILKNELEYLSKLIRTTNSKSIEYYYLMIKIALLEKGKKWDYCIKHCNQLIDLLNSTPFLYRKERVGSAYDNLAHFHFINKNIPEAILSLSIAQKHFLRNSNAFVISKEIECKFNFFLNNFSRSKEILSELLHQPSQSIGEFRKSKYNYYQACIHFASREFKEALQILNKPFEIEKDKTRWNIGIRILLVLTFLELNKATEASNALEAIRKYIERLGKKSDVAARDALIIDLLRTAEKDGFSFSFENERILQLTKQLNEKNTDHSWEHFSPEMIPIHTWVWNKQKKAALETA